MLKLYGIPMSNYFSMIKNALLEKDVHFQEVDMRPSQDPKYLAKSPMGKVPIIETEAGFLSESSAILDFIEESYPEIPLYPSDPYQRAKVREVMRVVEHYIEAPTHGMLGVMFGREVAESVQAHNEPVLDRGLAALDRLAKFEPFVLGERLSYADLSIFWSLYLAGQVAKRVYQRRILDEVEGLADWNKMMLQRPSTSRLVSESRAYVQKLMEEMNSARSPEPAD